MSTHEIPEDEYVRRVEHLVEQTTLGEKQTGVVALKSFGLSTEEIANRMNIDRATVRERLDAARETAREGERTANILDLFGVRPA